MDPKKIGNFGERIACYYLKNKGYEILERNYLKNWSAVRKGEIDIIAKNKDVICFVEVKTIQVFFGRKEALSGDSFPPEEKVNFQKRKKLIKLAETWLEEHKISFQSKWQIDIVAVKIDLERKRAIISHFENVVY